MRLSSVFVTLFAAVAVGCGAPHTDHTDAGPADAGPVDAGPPKCMVNSDCVSGSICNTTSMTCGVAPFPATFPTPPQVITGGGPVLSTPSLVPVFFAGDDATIVSEATDFVNGIGATSYWSTALTEWHVGTATATSPVSATAADLTTLGGTDMTITDASIQSWLGEKLNNNDTSYPTATANSVYVLFFPSGYSVTLPAGFGGQTEVSCQTFGGYHSDFALDSAHGGINVSYAVIPRCANFGGLTGIDAVTATASTRSSRHRPTRTP